MDKDDIIVNLKVIASIKKGDRLTTNTNFLNVDQRSIIPQFIRRWKNGESRDETIRMINLVVNTGLASKLDLDYLANCIEGLNSLKHTYTGDQQTQCRIDTIIDKIQQSIKSDSPVY